MRFQLRDVAPRLARARDDRQFELSRIDYPEIGLKIGDEFYRLLDVRRSVERCDFCGGALDRCWRLAEILVGPGEGEIQSSVSEDCRSCGRSRLTM